MFTLAVRTASGGRKFKKVLIQTQLQNFSTAITKNMHNKLQDFSRITLLPIPHPICIQKIRTLVRPNITFLPFVTPTKKPLQDTQKDMKIIGTTIHI